MTTKYFNSHYKLYFPFNAICNFELSQNILYRFFNSIILYLKKKFLYHVNEKLSNANLKIQANLET